MGIAGLLLLLMGLGIVGVAIAVVAKDGWKEEGRRCIIFIILDAVPMTIIQYNITILVILTYLCFYYLFSFPALLLLIVIVVDCFVAPLINPTF